MQVVVIGTGFVGVVTAAALASFGNQVTGLDIDPAKVASLQEGEVPFFEPGLTDLLKQELKNGRLRFTSSYQEAIPDAQVILVAVGTPSAPDGTADTTYVEAACQESAKYIADDVVIGIKSTVPPGIFSILTKKIKSITDKNFYLASLPEFLREGTAVEDTLHPDRVVIGCREAAAIERLKHLHEPFQAPIVIANPESAQMGKYAANAYLAQRITFINQIADLCEENGADVQEVIKIIGHDKRIGDHYWYPGFGYGGSCFPKDVRELAAYSRSVGQGDNLFNKINELNENRPHLKLQDFAESIGGWQDKKVAVLGLSFKPNTDDLREAPSLKVVPQLLHKGAQVKAYDPMAMAAWRRQVGAKPHLSLVDTLAEAVTDAEVIILLIEWPEIVGFDFASLPALAGGQRRTLIDVRNQLDPAKFSADQWLYLSIGRKNDQR